MDDMTLLRYSRHILLPEVGFEGQEKLSQATVLVIGLGGLGTPVATYLASSGIGTLILGDDDVVELTNLPRQILYSTQDIGQLKTDAAKARLTAINPAVNIRLIKDRFTETSLEHTIAEVDVVVDCSDNFKTRYALNQACVRYKKPLISGSAIGLNGQVCAFKNAQFDEPCYHCLFPDCGQDDEPRCSENGVLATLVAMVGTMQANTVLNILLEWDAVFHRLWMVSANNMVVKEARITQDATCPVCMSAEQH